MSDFRRHSSMGGASRQKVKIEYSIRIKEIAGLPKSTNGTLFITWKRGSKKENSGETKHVAVKDQKADFDFIIPLTCTLYQDPKKGFEEKSVVFTVKEEKGKKPTTLGKLAIDLAEFANSKTERIRTFQIKEKKAPVANITLSFKTTWLKMDGKTLIRADSAEASGKQKVEIDGNDYYLQTEDELSIDETDQKSGGGNDSDEEAVDFESDSDTVPRSPSNKRKSLTTEGGTNSVSSVPPKTNSSTSTPTQQSSLSSLSSPSPSQSSLPSPSPSPSSNSTAPVTSPVSDAKDGEDPKVKKYKKKLKTSRKEIDDLKAELTKKDELVKAAAQQGGAATAEITAQLSSLQKKEQESEEREAKLRSELDEANKKVAEAKAEVEASRKGGDEASQQKDAKIKQLEEAISTRDDKQRELEQELELARQDNKGRADLESKISSLEESGKRAEERAVDLEHKLDKEKQRADEKENKAKELEEELERERTQSAERGSQEGGAIQELQRSLDSEKQKAQEWETKYKNVEEASRANEQKAEELEAQLTKEKESSAAEIARLGLLIATLEKGNDEKVKLESELKLAKDEHEATVEALNAKVASLEEQIRDSLNAQEGERAAEVDLLKSDIASAEERAIQAERRADGLQNRINESEQETSNAKKKLEEEVQRLQKRTKELEMQLASESGKDNELVADMQARASDLETQLSEAISSNESHAKQIAQLNFTIQELEEEKEKAASAGENDQEARKQLEGEIEQLKVQVATLEVQVQGGSDTEELISELKTKNQNAEDEISKLKQQLEEAESDLEQARESSNKGGADASQIQELEDDVKKYKKKAKKAEEQALEMEKQLDEAKAQLEQQQQNGEGSEESEVKFIELDKKYRAVKSKVEDLDDEADRLRKRELVLTELNETSERRIEELEAELKNSNTHATTNGGSAPSEEAAELQKELDEVMQEAANLKVRVKELEEEVAKKESSKSLGGSGAIVSGGSEDVNKLLRELEEHKKVEKAIYWDEIGFTPADVSKTATSVWQLLAATRELDAEDQPADQPLTSLAQKVITALDKSFRRSAGDNKQIAYWLSCTCSLLHFIHQRDDVPPSADPVLQGAQVNPEHFVNGPTHAEQFARALQQHALNVYGQLAVNFQEHIQKFIIPAFLHEDQAVMDANQKATTQRTSSFAVMSSPPGSPLSPHSSHQTPSVALPSLTLLTNTLASVHTLLREAKCPAAVVRQFFHQLLHFISGCVLNALLYGKEVSTATHGLRIKLAVSRIDEWLAKQENDIAGTGERMNLLRDTANVLVLDKSLFLDADTITSIFHTLNLVQVRKLLDLFQPDSVAPAGVPAGVKQMMDTYWGYSPHNLPLLVDVTALVVVN